MEFPVVMQAGQWPFLIAVIIFVAAALTAIWKIGQIVKRAGAPLKELMQEHNILWEDYNIRAGGSYRRASGRGNPVDPAELYADYPNMTDPKDK
jgi:hypothetical protein